MFAADIVQTFGDTEVSSIRSALQVLEQHKVFEYFLERMISNPAGQESHQAMIEYGKSLGRHEVIGQLRNFVEVIVVPLKQQKQIPITYGAQASNPVNRKVASL